MAAYMGRSAGHLRHLHQSRRTNIGLNRYVLYICIYGGCDNGQHRHGA